MTEYFVKFEQVEGYESWKVDMDGDNHIAISPSTEYTLDDNSNLLVKRGGQVICHIPNGEIFDVMTAVLLMNKHSTILGKTDVIRTKPETLYGGRE